MLPMTKRLTGVIVKRLIQGFINRREHDMTHDMVKYNMTDSAIAKMAEDYMGIIVTGPGDAENFKTAHNARIVVKGMRVDVEKCRKEFKAEALEYGRKVDAEAKRLTALLQPIEDHLIAQERVVTDEQERIKREAEEAEAARIATEEKARRDAEEARIRAERAAEQKKLDEERERLASERAAMEAERKRAQAEQAARQKEEDTRLEAKRAAMEAKMRVEQERMAAIEAEQKAERDRLAKIEAEQRAEAERIAAEKKAIADAEAAKARAAEMEKAKAEAAAKANAETEARLAREAEEARNREIAEQARVEAERKAAEALRPDVEKIRAIGIALGEVEIPRVSTPKADTFRRAIVAAIRKICDDCAAFGKNHKRST